MTSPSSTYRIQLHKDFTFQQLEEILDYLQELGVSTVYASPITTATKGSQHGYDVTNPLVLNPEIGTEEELKRLARLLKDRNMTWLQDIVPNHMAFESNNGWLWDVLERGKRSEYYRFFDIDTEHRQELTGARIMAPFLGKTLTECLQEKELGLEFRGAGSDGTDAESNGRGAGSVGTGRAADAESTTLNAGSGAGLGAATEGFVIRYYDNLYPVSFASYTWICTIADGCPPDLLTSIEGLASVTEGSAALNKGSAAHWAAEKTKWVKAVAANEAWMNFLRQRVLFFGEHPSLLAELLDSQEYILTHGHLAASRINYRRFFTVSSLICLRMEDPAVFSAYHVKIQEWYRKGYIQGLRIDHIDGLAFPREYARKLRRLFGADCYIVAEKILAADEEMPGEWPMEGSSGYDFLAIVNQLLTDGDGYRELIAFYREHIIESPAYDDIVFSKKYHFLKTQMGGEWDNLLDILYSLSLLEAEKMDREALKEALAILLSSLPVYRVYPEAPGSGLDLSQADRRVVDMTFARAAGRYPDGKVPPSMRFLSDLFLSTGESELDRQKEIFQARLMQFTGPLAAKGIEDTTFYVYNPLISRNEVGDSPALETMTPEQFHQKMGERQRKTPYAQNASSTHDTKRGEDGRIRLNWLSAIPEQWIRQVTEWRRINAPFCAQQIGSPSSNDEYLIYQALLGSFPTDLLVTDTYRERFHQYLTKALREAKTNTNYDQPNEAYEKGCHDFVSGILQEGSAFLEVFVPFVFEVIRDSTPYSLAQSLIKLTAPGVPDIYQGAESWDHSLVDPDNRNPVDYAERRKILAGINAAEREGQGAVQGFLAAHAKEGAAKLYTVHKALSYRREHPEVFASGEYIPVGAPDSHLAFIRRDKEEWIMVVVPLIRRLGEEWTTPESNEVFLTLPPGAPSHWISEFTADEISSEQGAIEHSSSSRILLDISSLLKRFPVILLKGKDSSR